MPAAISKTAARSNRAPDSCYPYRRVNEADQVLDGGPARDA